jgi:large conductance mechanosensitive channel
MREFKKFILRGNVMDMAIGVIIGLAFGAIVTSMVADIIMPPIGLLLGKVEFANLYILLKEGSTAAPYVSLDAAKEAGAVTINYGLFINTIVSFIIIVLVLFFMIRAINKLNKKEDFKEKVNTKKCSYCFSVIHIEAKRCPHCTSAL